MIADSFLESMGEIAIMEELWFATSHLPYQFSMTLVCWLVQLSQETLKVSPTRSPAWACNSLGSWGKMPTDLLQAWTLAED